MPKIPRVVTHSGSFQPDDIFAVATLQLLLGEVEIIRSRNPEVVAASDYAVDVGFVHDAENNRFDHHQEGGAGASTEGIPYSAFGLVWKAYGEKICGSAKVAERIREKIVEAIDADDHGVQTWAATGAVRPYPFVEGLYVFNPTWKEPDSVIDDQFKQAVSLAKAVLSRTIIRERDRLEAESLVEEAYGATDDKRVIVLDQNLPAQEALARHPEPLYVVKPDRQSDRWKIQVIDIPQTQFGQRKPLPAAWAGKQAEELEKISGVPGAWFCHQLRFVAIAQTKEAAIALAKLAADA